MKEIFLGDINYNNNYDTKMPNFYRKHRYDIKKPGPKYYEEYFFKPDMDESSEDETDKLSNEPILLEQVSWRHTEWALGVFIIHLIVKLITFTSFTQKRDNNVKSTLEEMPISKCKANQFAFYINWEFLFINGIVLAVKKKDKSIRSNKPVSEGPVKVDAKSENTLIIRSAEVGEETSLEAIDSTHTYVVTDKM